ncbi:UNVERIFIED_CONTAM: hypothetical protein FKN15_032302 [Acipenser sinensis]
MPYSNRELVKDFISYKLSQKNLVWNQVNGDSRTGSAGVLDPDSERDGGHVNGSINGTDNGSSLVGIEAVKEALRDSGDEFELRYRRAFSDLSSQLHITPGTAYQSFEQVVNELFRDGVNWGRVVALFAFGGALCVESVEKEMGSLVGRIADWMTTYLDSNIEPWIQRQGGWVSGQLCTVYRYSTGGRRFKIIDILCNRENKLTRHIEKAVQLFFE